MTTEVRAITVKQPWAWAIAAGHKLVENRSQGTRYRGLLLIHAGKGWSARGADDPRIAGVRTPGPWRDLAYGSVLAVARLVDSHPDAGCCRPWGESEYSEAGGRVRTVVHHLVLEDVRALEQPVPARGALGLWRPPGDVLELLELAGVPL